MGPIVVKHVFLLSIYETIPEYILVEKSPKILSFLSPDIRSDLGKPECSLAVNAGKSIWRGEILLLYLILIGH